MIFWVRATLGADDINLAGALDGVVNLERFSQIARHRFLAIDVFAGVQGVDRHLGVPVIHGGNQHCVDVLSVEQLSVIAVRGGVSQAQEPLSGLQPFLINIANRRLRDVIFLSMGLLELQVRGALTAHANVTDDNAIVGSDNSSGRGRLALAVNGGFQ